MKCTVAVIGMGQGGMVAAIKLATAGASVTIYEKSPEGAVSYPWRDDIRFDIFQKVGLQPPPEAAYVQKPSWLFVAPDYSGTLAVPMLKPLEEVSINRQALSAHLAALAVEAGCVIRYNTPVRALWVEHERVVGVQCGEEKEGYNLVIDASGMMSPFRGQVPASFGVQSRVDEQDYLVGYRAFFEPNEGADTYDPDIDCTLIAKHGGGQGISWCNRNPDGLVDVLIGRVGHLDRAEIEELLQDLRAHHPLLGERLVSERTVPICLRKGIACPVADGYVALGDSAFMTIPVMGSGIEASMQGGALFAQWAIAHDLVDFTAASMWGFYVEYMRMLGRGFALMDVARRYLLQMDARYIRWFFTSGILNYDDLAFIMLEEGYGKPKFHLLRWLAKPFYLLAKPRMSAQLVAMVRQALKAMRIAKAMPKHYDADALAKWRARYDGHLAKVNAKAARLVKDK